METQNLFLCYFAHQKSIGDNIINFKRNSFLLFTHFYFPLINSLLITINNFFINFLKITETTGTGIYRSSNNGNNWVAVNNGIQNVGFNCITSTATHIYAGCLYAYVYISSNNGAGRYSSCNDLPSAAINSTIINGSNLYVCTYMNGVYHSSNNGVSWFYAGNGLPNQIIQCLASSGANLFAVTDTAGNGGVYISTNYGGNRTRTSIPYTNVASPTFSGNNLFAGTWNLITYTNSGIYVTTNYGVNWYLKNNGLSDSTGVLSTLITNNYIYAGTNKSVWRRPISEVIVVENISSEIPSSFSLSQNYPNPFNPTTKIRFDIPALSFPNAPIGNPLVTLKIFDMLGKELETLVNEQLRAAIYETNWNASQYPSGIYFYKLSVTYPTKQTGNFSETKKMSLIK